MDQIKIGLFIAKIRKEKGMTQKQLAEELSVSDKAVSKWETGKGMPEVSLMQPLCAALGISVNELLSGERIAEENYKERAEETMVSLLADRQGNIRRLVLEVLVICATLTAMFLLGAVGRLYVTEKTGKVILAIATMLVALFGMAVARSIDRKAGYFECTKCHTVFQPDTKTYLKGSLTVLPMSARFCCPECKKTTKCKRRFTK